MMFSAGMGIGLMFFGVAEPISHLAAPPLGLAKPNTEAAAATAMEWTYFHWTLQAWALYAVVGLALGYFCFRKGMPNLISSVFYPLLGDRVNGPIGKAIDILAIFATMFGSATSLGLGALQINSGLNFVWDVETSTGLAVVIIAVLTLAFVLSAVSGVGKGVQFLSNFNMVVAVALLVFIFVAGPTVYILGTLVSATGDYFAASSAGASRPASRAARSGWAAGRSSTGCGGSRGRRSSARSWRASPRAGRSASSSSACC